MLRRTSPVPPDGGVTFLWEGRPVRARAGESVAAALLAAGVTAFRNTAVSGVARGPYCMMGACWDCVAIVDGVGGAQTCLVPVREGMRVEHQRGARSLPELDVPEGVLPDDPEEVERTGAAS